MYFGAQPLQMSHYTAVFAARVMTAKQTIHYHVKRQKAPKPAVEFIAQLKTPASSYKKALL
jgi:hypothetical protein